MPCLVRRLPGTSAAGAAVAAPEASGCVPSAAKYAAAPSECATALTATARRIAIASGERSLRPSAHRPIKSNPTGAKRNSRWQGEASPGRQQRAAVRRGQRRGGGWVREAPRQLHSMGRCFQQRWRCRMLRRSRRRPGIWQGLDCRSPRWVLRLHRPGRLLLAWSGAWGGEGR